MGKKKGGHGGGGGGGHDAGGGLRWLLTYADMITLLLALFIFLYSISNVNATKLRNFSTKWQELFGIGGVGNIPGKNSSDGKGEGLMPEANAAIYGDKRIEKLPDDAFEKIRVPSMVVVEKTNNQILFRLNNKITFSTGEVEVSDTVKPILKELAQYLNLLHAPIRVEGHTDALPLSQDSNYTSNWELSADRAAAVANYLVDQCHVDPKRISVVGYAEFKPLKQNDPRLGNTENRRVEIIIPITQ